jgi:hypothetical protein
MKHKSLNSIARQTNITIMLYTVLPFPKKTLFLQKIIIHGDNRHGETFAVQAYYTNKMQRKILCLHVSFRCDFFLAHASGR